MFDYIEQHKRIFLIGAIVVIVGMLIVLLLVNNKQTTPSGPDTGPNELNYSFLQDDIPEEDQYLMLQGKILTEGYGTYSAVDTRGLQDVQNQATDSFKAEVQDMIDSFSSSVDISSMVDPDSIKLERNDNGVVVVTMDVTTVNNETQQETTGESSVTLLKQGQYWLTSRIVIEYK